MEVTVNNCTAVDSIIVDYDPISTISLGNDTTLCEGESLTLDVSTQNASYLWHDNSTNPVYLVSGAGTVFVEVTSLNSGCSVSDTMVCSVDAVSVDILSADTVLCAASDLVIQANQTGFSDILWAPQANVISQNANSANMSFTGSTLVYATAIGSTGYCTATDSMQVNFEAIPPALIVDTVIFDDQAFAYSPTGTWSDGSQNVGIVSINEEGIYTYLENHACGTTTHEFSIATISCDCNVYIPNAFTPDGDQTNNVFSVVSDCVFAEYHLTLYNRWGEIIFESYNENESWDGTYSGRYVQDGTYTWKLTYTDTITKVPEELVGHVTILR